MKMESSIADYIVSDKVRHQKYIEFLNEHHEIIYKYQDLLLDKIPLKYQKYIDLDDFSIYIFMKHYQ